MAEFVYHNNAITELISSVDSGDTTISVQDASVFPDVSGDEVCRASILGDDTYEIVDITDVNTNDNTVTVERAKEGTTAQTFSAETTITATITAEILNRFAENDELAAVATTGDYNDLSNTPDLADVATSGDYEDLSNTPNFADVATSGDYNDLSNTPDFGSAAFEDTGYFVVDPEDKVVVDNDDEEISLNYEVQMPNGFSSDAMSKVNAYFYAGVGAFEPGTQAESTEIALIAGDKSDNIDQVIAVPADGKEARLGTKAGDPPYVHRFEIEGDSQNGEHSRFDFAVDADSFNWDTGGVIFRTGTSTGAPSGFAQIFGSLQIDPSDDDISEIYVNGDEFTMTVNSIDWVHFDGSNQTTFYPPNTVFEDGNGNNIVVINGSMGGFVVNTDGFQWDGETVATQDWVNNQLADVATSGDYNDLNNTPDLDDYIKTGEFFNLGPDEGELGQIGGGGNNDMYFWVRNDDSFGNRIGHESSEGLRLESVSYDIIFAVEADNGFTSGTEVLRITDEEQAEFYTDAKIENSDDGSLNSMRHTVSTSEPSGTPEDGEIWMQVED